MTAMTTMTTPHPWNSHRGAVSITFDDGTVNQLEKAIPPLDERGLKGTFYLNPRGEDWQQRLEPWVAVGQRGHELGNHTLQHTCSIMFANAAGVRRGRYLENMTLQEVEEDILTAQERLALLAPQQREWTFAYPCYCTHVGAGVHRQSYVPVVARHFLAGRGGGEFGFANPPQYADLSCLGGQAIEDRNGFEVIGLIEELAVHQGRWLILVLHAIDGPRLNMPSSAYKMVLDYLARRQADVWTAPMHQVARRVADFQRALAEDHARPATTQG